MHDLPTYLINLDRNPERLVQAQAALAQLGVVATRVAAVDGRALDLAAVPGYRAEDARAVMGRDLSAGEIGCYLSHLICAQRIAEGPAPYALVLEDDVALRPDSAPDLAALIAALPDLPAFDLINLGRPATKFARGLRVLPSGRVLGRAYYFPVTTSALLWSRAGAARFVAAHRLVAPVDVALQAWLSGSGRGMALRPALLGVSGAQSQIDAPRADRKAQTGRAANYTALRLRRQGRNYARAALGWLLRRG